jgi:hypothetical protein
MQQRMQTHLTSIERDKARLDQNTDGSSKATEDPRMSQFNGDKSRYNRVRKQNIQRRKRNRALFEAAGGTVATQEPAKKSGGAAGGAKDHA